MSSFTATTQKYPTWRYALLGNGDDASSKDGELFRSWDDRTFQEIENNLSGGSSSVLLMVVPPEERQDGATKEKPNLSILHHLTKLDVSKTSEKEDKTIRADESSDQFVFTALQGLEAKATPVELALEKLFYHHKVEIRAPKWQILKTITSHDKLTKILKGQEGEDSTVTNETEYLIRKLQVVPPALEKVVLRRQQPKSSSLTDDNDISSPPSPETLLLEVLQAIRDSKVQVKKNQKGVVSDIPDGYCRGLVAFLWDLCLAGPETKLEVSGEFMTHTKLPQVLEWSKMLHEEFVDRSLKLEESAEVETKDAGSGSSSSRKGTGRRSRTWQENYIRLVAYKDMVGDCNVPREYAKDKALGEWVKNQRSVSKTLPKDRRAQLEEIGFTFSSTQLDRSKKIWDANYEKLVLLTKKYEGNFTKALKEDKSLQHWVTLQRQSYRRGHLDEERKKKLDEIDFVWKIKNDYTPRKKNDMQWQKGYAKLLEFHQEHKHCNVPKRSTDCRPLWEWVYSQRKAYSEKRLPADRIKLMEELGMVWDNDMGQVIRDTQWKKKFDNAKNFFDKHQHLEVPRSGKFGDNNLLKWLLRQREQFKNDKLSPNRKKMLEDLKFDFEGKSERRDRLLEDLNFKERYEELEVYKKEKGGIPEAGTNPKEKSLAKWVAKCQVAYQFYDLDPGRKKMLDKLGVVFPTQMPEPPIKKRKSLATPSRKAAAARAARPTQVSPMLVDKEMDAMRLPALKLPTTDNSGAGMINSADDDESGQKAKSEVANKTAREAIPPSEAKLDCSGGTKSNGEKDPITRTRGAPRGQKRKAKEELDESAAEGVNSSVPGNGKKSESNDLGPKVRRGMRDRGVDSV